MTTGSGYEKLKKQTSLKDILAVATEFERTARDFYSDMVPKVSKKIRYLLEELAEEEQRHYDLFSQLAKREDIIDQVQEMVDTPTHDRRFSDCIHLPELGDTPDDQSVLQYALMREHAAMEQYSELAKINQEGPIKKLFEFLANEETKHKVELEKIYYEIVHSGGV